MINTDDLILALGEVQGYLNRPPARLTPRERGRWVNALQGAQDTLEQLQGVTATLEVAAREVGNASLEPLARKDHQ